MRGAPFGDADDHMAAAQVLDHRRGDVAGMGARRCLMTILSTQPYRRTGDDLADPVQQCRRRTDQQIGRERSAPRLRSRSSARASTPSARRPFIFQLPAINVRRDMPSPLFPGVPNASVTTLAATGKEMTYTCVILMDAGIGCDGSRGIVARSEGGRGGPPPGV